MTAPDLSKTKRKVWFRRAALIALVLLAYWAGGLGGGTPESALSNTPMVAAETGNAQQTVWTCVMHPQIRRNEPGPCPICGMDLIPLDDTGDDEQRRLVMSPAARKLAEIQTAPVERKYVDAEVRLVGSLELDETRVRSISSYVPGRIDRLYINYTGIPVKRGDHLADLYSPDLLTAQQELLEAKRRVDQSGERSEFLRESDARALESAREKLRLLGFTNAQIAEIEKRGTASDHMLVTAPSSGVVVRKMVNEGDYVETGTPIYTVAEMDRLWVMLDAYESDLMWLHYGQPVDLQTEAYPGEHFSGIIAFIDPVLDTTSRTAKLRVNVENPEGRLKPGMFVHATVHSRVASGGRVMDPMLADKWISPMHPEIVRDEPGDCPVCGMDLVRAEELGYVTSADMKSMPLVVPASAVLRTGRRAVVYIEVPDAERPTYEGREITLGPRAGDYYLVADGLAEGEHVVTNGNFNIDSALQIQARPSMMSVDPAGDHVEGDLAAIRRALEPIYQLYFTMQQALAADDLAGAIEQSARLRSLANGIDETLVRGAARNTWLDSLEQINVGTAGLDTSSSIEQARSSFRTLSNALIEVQRNFGHRGDAVHYEMHCPMAFGDGASWLQMSEALRNPYYGASMLTCGTTEREYPPAADTPARAPQSPSGHNH